MNRYAALTLALIMATAMQAQSDKSLYGGSMVAIPGTNAVAMRPSSTLTPQLTTSGYAVSAAIDHASSAPSSGATSAQGLCTDAADVTSKKSAKATTDADSTLYYPTHLSSYYCNYGWLHKGLNASLDLSVFAQFGKHARHGAGFSQRLSATYVQPLGKRSWMAVGGYVDHLNWSGDSYTSGGLYAELGYQFNEHWSAYVYGQKSLVNSGISGFGSYYGRGWNYLSPYSYNGLGDKLGAAVRWTPNPTLSVELSVEHNWYPKGNAHYFDQYNYPTPQP